MTRPSTTPIPAIAALWCVALAVLVATSVGIGRDLGPSLASASPRVIYGCLGGSAIAFLIASVSALALTNAQGERAHQRLHERDLRFFWNVALLGFAAALAAYLAHKTGYLP